MAVRSKSRRIIAIGIVLALTSACWISAIALFMNAIWPVPSMEEDMLIRKGSFTLDVGHLADGYFLAKREPCSNGLKLRITKDKAIYTYDLNNQGEYEVFPLQMGNGVYKCTLYRNVKGTKYATEAEVKLDVEMTNEYVPYLVPNQYVNYNEETYAVQASLKLCEGLETPEEKLQVIREFIRENFTYDYERAKRQKSFYLGDANECFETRKGLCQDYAVMLCSMLRVQGIPTKMVLGYAENFYHAWNQVLIGDEYQLIDVTAEISSGKDRFRSYTPERYY